MRDGDAQGEGEAKVSTQALEDAVTGVPTYPVRLPVKVAVLSPYLPPDNMGTSILLYRVFRDVEPDDYCLLSSRPLGESAPPDPRRYAQPRLPARLYSVEPRFRLRRYS